ncbi:hypothetical protein B0T21DRAFT_162636 [Apiosordaria backusii]|uniref:Uncharacterized protein n=1 Tax=Apiosordaria backusii TaxID=314023 RepID=A0AA40BN99_9PEZI|nr:hypothetical protein B0T21DRAFT_162636 [Apiosordaria backusii]
MPTQHSYHYRPRTRSFKSTAVFNGVVSSTMQKFGVSFCALIPWLYIISVNEEIFQGARNVIADELGQDKADRMVWMKCDLSDWRRVKEVAETIKRDSGRLDILVNNSGRGIMSAELTSYGVDKHMAVNHIGHVVHKTTRTSKLFDNLPSSLSPPFRLSTDTRFPTAALLPLHRQKSRLSHPDVVPNTNDLVHQPEETALGRGRRTEPAYHMRRFTLLEERISY